MGKLRIIAGTLRGRRIPVPAGSLRPTSDRAREGLFGVLGPRLAGARILDLYAGTGALGIEGLSRGARSAVFVERDRRLADHLRRQLELLELAERGRVLQGDVALFLTRGLVAGPFDLVLADPPYDLHLSPEIVAAATGLLVSGGVLALEREASAGAVEPRGGALWRTVRYGRTAFDLLLAGHG